MIKKSQELVGNCDLSYVSRDSGITVRSHVFSHACMHEQVCSDKEIETNVCLNQMV